MNNELDDMKQVWQNSSKAASTLDEQQVLSMLSARSKSALASLRNNLLFEALVGVVLVGVLIRLAVIAPNDQARFAMIQLCMLVLPLSIFYYYGLKSLNNGISLTGNVREYLEASIRYWERALRIYFWGGMMMLPTVIITAGWYRMSIMGETDIQMFGGSTVIVIAKILISTLIISISVWVLIRVSYGIYVDRLKKCLQELKKED